MATRREFLLGGAALAGMSSALVPEARGAEFVSRRPPLAKRNFTSEAVEATIATVKRTVADPEIGWLFENCFPNTLDTTVRFGQIDGQPDTFVITGDINAMWLRDSSAQVWPYLPLAKDDAKLKALLAGVIRRQTRCILIDPYANAFNYEPGPSPWANDLTKMRPELHERKWEIDSLCYPIRLAHGYWKATGDASCFDRRWQDAALTIYQTFRDQQRMESPGPYKFQRRAENPGDTLPGGGYGAPTRPCGLIHSGFRPSDDACIFPFLIPSNFFAVRSLEQLAEIFEAELPNKAFARDCRALAGEVRDGLARFAKARRAKYGEVFAYEADGYGNQLFLDDAGVPGLLSLPYLGTVEASDPVYRNTRRLVLSTDNPYYFKGTAGEGVSGPHAGQDMVWPMGIIVRALTSESDDEIRACVKMLKTTHAGTGFIHEAFHKNDPKNYTRPWFAWANTLFGELILTLLESRPRLLKA